MLNNRPLLLTARNLFRPSNYVALARATRTYEQPRQAVIRYLRGNGDFPCSVQLRTPLGPQTVSLFCGHDAITVHEIFCRRDYWLASPPKVVVDLGSNIGISALYFLTRSATTYCDLYEPDPRNICKLRSNLASFEDRITVHESAVADREGALPFSREPTGRYGSLHPAPWLQGRTETLTVQVEHVNTALERALSRAGTVDLLKIDTEGTELATVWAIDPALRGRIRHIMIEWRDHKVGVDGFQTTSRCDVVHFTNRRLGLSS